MHRRGIKSLAILLAIAAPWLVGGCQNDLPKLTERDGSIGDSCQTFADLLLAYSPPGSEGGSDEGSAALGPPDESSVLLEANAVLAVGFVSLGGLVDETGDDLRVHGSVAEGSDVAVYVGDNVDALVFSGSLGPEDLDVDLSVASASRAVYIRLVVLTGSASVDALEALQTTCPSP